MTSQTDTVQTITLDGKEFEVAKLSSNIQQLVAIHTIWRDELTKERLKVAKTENALRALEQELSSTLAAEVDESAPQDAVDAVDAEIVEE